MPKGVMWSHRIWRESSLESMLKIYGFAPESMEQHLVLVDQMGKLSRQLPACPLMHGTGLFTAMGAMIGGGAIVTLENTKHFDPVELWELRRARFHCTRRGGTARLLQGSGEDREDFLGGRWRALCGARRLVHG